MAIPGATLYNINIYDAANMPVSPNCDGCTGTHAVTGLAGGTYTVTTDNVDTPCPQMASFTVDTRPSPSVEIIQREATDGSGRTLLTATLDPEGRDPADAMYLWTDPNGINFTTNTPDYPFNDADEGTYTVVATVEGCPLRTHDATSRFGAYANDQRRR